MDNLTETDLSWKKLRTTKRCILLCGRYKVNTQAHTLWAPPMTVPDVLHLLTRAKYHQAKTYNASEFDPYPDVISNVILPQFPLSLA